MAFGFFKKSEVADIIFTGGRIFTQNSDLPEVEAVACKDGLILAVGDYEDLEELKGKHTEIVDLDGCTMLPGYIDTYGHPVLHAFQNSCLFLQTGGMEDTLKQISDYASEKNDLEVIFAYGFDERIMEGYQADQTRASLDEISSEKPIIVLGKGGFHCWINTIALETVKSAAEEDEVTTITLPYLLSILEPFEMGSIPENLPADMAKYCTRGFTSVFDCGAPDYFASTYQSILVHLFQENMIKQRFFGSLLINCDVNSKYVMHKLAQFRTNCVELNEYVNFQTLKLVVDRTDESPLISDETVKELCYEAGDKGFDIHIDAIGPDAIVAAIEAMEATRAAGYKKNSFTLAYDHAIDLEDLFEHGIRSDITESGLTLSDDDWLCIKNAKSIEEAVDMLTIEAAEQLGISNRFGSIEKGKHADFVIFEKNPFESEDLASFKKLQSFLTIIDSTIVYNAKEDDISNWHTLFNPPLN